MPIKGLSTERNVNYKPFRVKQGGFLPLEYDAPHDLCLYLHDVMAGILKDGEEGGFFQHTVRFSLGDPAKGWDDSEDPIQWMQENGYGTEIPPMARSNCSTDGHLNCSRQDGLNYALEAGAIAMRAAASFSL
jgi:hypothetical protein